MSLRNNTHRISAALEGRAEGWPPPMLAGEAESDPARALSHEQIRLRAYEIYLARGATPGDPVADWLRAEHELAADRLRARIDPSLMADAARWSDSFLAGANS
ncbi:DUF2934 domain-containing protein [Leptolyngbya sp. 15MV]|nr:DUF2934 domain-containing protein [Leptolyngbya sp. 15MV]